MSWPKACLGDVAQVVSGATPKSSVDHYWDGDIPWITPADLSRLEGKEVTATSRLLTEAGLSSCSSRLLPPRSVLFSSRAPIGHVAINTVPMATNQGFKSFIPNQEILSPDYLYWWLKSSKLYLQSLGRGATFKEVSKEIVESIEIPLPPLEEQRRIAAILDASHKLQRLHRQRVDGLFGLRQSMYRQLFGLPGSELLPLSSLAKITSGYAFKAADFCSQGVHVIRMSDLNGEDVDLASSALVPAEVVEGLERFELFEGDILLGMSGSLGKLGIVPFIPAGTRAFLNQRVAKISLLQNTPISRELLVESIKSREYIAHLERCAAGVAVRNVSAAQMLDFAIPAPSRENARRFSEACNGVSAQIVRSEHCIMQSKELQASLVEAFIGKP